jgi:hypothetical protein
VFALLNEEEDYSFLMGRYAYQNFDYIIVFGRDFPVDIDALIVGQDLNKAIYLTDRPSQTSSAYFLVEKDYSKLLKNFKNEGKKELSYQIYSLNADK